MTWRPHSKALQPLTVRAIALAIVAACAIWAATGAPAAGAAREPCVLDGIERVVAVGDVHGAYDRLVEILQTTGLLDARLHWAGGKTHLVQTGDVLDRGPDSRTALDLLRRLVTEAAGAGGAVHLLLGNHEVMRMLGDLRYVTPGEYAAFVRPDSERTRETYVRSAKPDLRDQFLKDTPLGLVEMRVAFGHQGNYGEWLRQLPVVVKIDGVLFLHGGISPAVAGLSCEAINTTVRRELTDDLDRTRAAPLKTLAARADGPLWYRGLAQEPDTFAPQVEEILSKQQARAIVIGHTVVPNGRIVARFDRKVIQIDTGMQPAYVPDGRASALEIRNGVFTAIYQDRRDVLSIPTTEPPR